MGPLAGLVMGPQGGLDPSSIEEAIRPCRLGLAPLSFRGAAGEPGTHNR
jgi:hypothetical protein